MYDVHGVLTRKKPSLKVTTQRNQGSLESSKTWKSPALAIACLFALGCNRSADTTVNQPDSKSLAQEANGVAQKFADLTYAKCSDGYYEDGGRRPKAALTVKATDSYGQLSDQQQHFLGYQWYGTADVLDSRDGGGATYHIYKRGGIWYYSPSSDGDHKGETDVPVDLLQSIKPACPTAG
jgi:hypothetical protein